MLEGDAGERKELKDWLSKVRQEVLVVRRHRPQGPGGSRGYGHDPDRFPNAKGQKYQRLVRDKTKSLPWHCSTLSRQKVLDAKRIRDRRDRDKHYPALLVNDGKLDDDPITIMAWTNFLPDDKRDGEIQFKMYFTRDFGRELTQALQEGKVAPGIFPALYDEYYPLPREGLQEIATGKEEAVFLMQGDPIEGGRKVGNSSITRLETLRVNL